jgi:hypothetical protein
MLLLLPCFALGCTDLSGFQTGPDERYAGVVVGSDDVTCGDDASCSFIRRGFSSGTRLSMTFDPAARTTGPGELSTSGEACGASLDRTPLMAIPALAHDSLSLYDFPGEGRLENQIYALRPETGPLAGRDMMAFVSLIEGGRIEVRLISGSGREPCAQSECDRYARHECDYFGVFNLRRESVSP